MKGYHGIKLPSRWLFQQVGGGSWGREDRGEPVPMPSGRKSVGGRHHELTGFNGSTSLASMIGDLVVRSEPKSCRWVALVLVQRDARRLVIARNKNAIMNQEPSSEFSAGLWYIYCRTYSLSY